MGKGAGGFGDGMEEGSGTMRQGKKPTLKQKQLLQQYGKNPADWLVIEDTPTELRAVYRFSDRTVKIFQK